MAQIIFYNDPTGATGREYLEFNGSITEFLMTRSIDLDHLTIELNGELITLSKDNPDERLFRDLTVLDRVVIINSPKGEIIAAVIVAVVAAVAVTLLMPAVNPGDMGVKKDSPNNSLGAQTNQARPYQHSYSILQVYPPLPCSTNALQHASDLLPALA